MVKKKTHKLTFTPDFNFTLFGISSHLNDYKLIWSVNSELAVNFSKQDNLKIEDDKLNEVFEFVTYSYYDEARNLKYRIIANRTVNGYLLPEIKNIDYILHLSGDAGETFQNDLFKNLKAIKSIQAVFKLNVNDLKSKKRLVF